MTEYKTKQQVYPTPAEVSKANSLELVEMLRVLSLYGPTSAGRIAARARELGGEKMALRRATEEVINQRVCDFEKVDAAAKAHHERKAKE